MTFARPGAVATVGIFDIRQHAVGLMNIEFGVTGDNHVIEGIGYVGGGHPQSNVLWHLPGTTSPPL